ncbi:MAG: hypothetical protein HUU32_09855 [Calditrichaceae bacterium]|nr:dockerin type I domain-containing protein [Calditrichia bacterium]NUQ41684.1 hypothetical protein [Calditrichaceae bacterium]
MKKLLILSLTVFLVSALSAQVYINELDYDQPGTDATEFIELAGPDNTSLNGYTIELVNGFDGAVYQSADLTGFTIPPDNVGGYGFFVVGAAAVTNVDFTPAAWPATNIIQNGAPDGVLLKLNGVVVDGFSYEGAIDNNPDFTPGMAISAAEDNLSPNLSIGRILFGFDPNNQDQYFAPLANTPSPGEVNTAHGQVIGGNIPPSISNISRTPKIPAANENTTVTATVTDPGTRTITTVELHYTINGGGVQAVTMANIGGDNYSGDIPAAAYNDADRVEYWIFAEDDGALTSESARSRFFAGNTPIAAVRPVDANGVMLYDGYDARLTGVATVEDSTFSPTNLDVYIQDASGGINLFAFGLNTDIIRYNSYTVVGTIDQFNGKAEIIPADQVNDIIDNGPATPPAPQVKTIAQLLADAETLEGLLIQVLQADTTGVGDPWPAAGLNANIEITDDGGISLLTLRIDADTDIDGSPEPSWPADITGIFLQFDNSSPFTAGYQLQPRSVNDISSGCLPGLLGDINGDGAVNSLDALLMLSYDAGLPLPQPFLDRIALGFGDVTEDGLTNSTDALVTLSWEVGFTVPFPVGDPVCL